MVYQYKTGTRHVVPVETVVQELNKLDVITAKNVVDAARDEAAPLHREFEWDDSIAGECWRESQARELIRHIVIVPEDAPMTEPVRAYHHLTIESRAYTPMEVIIKNTDMTEQLLKQAKAELQTFKRKYAGIEALSKLFVVIDELTA